MSRSIRAAALLGAGLIVALTSPSQESAQQETADQFVARLNKDLTRPEP